jgi:dihydrofolate reductase
MGKLTFDIAVSLDGYAAGPNQSKETPLGEGGEELHDWMIRLASWREKHGHSGGETGPDAEADAEVVEESVRNVGAYLMGRNMFGGGEGPWGSDPAFGEDWQGWWGDDPPYHVPVFVLTHHEREPLEMQGGTTFHFVTDGIESALGQAREAAGDRDVRIAGGADVVRQYLRAGLVDEFQIHVAPLMLGGGETLLGELGSDAPQVELTKTVASPTVTHMSYRVVK